VLGRAVPGRVRLALDTGDRGDVDDVAAAGEQVRQRGPAQVERPVQVDREVLRPVLVIHRLGPTHLVAPGDVDQHIEPAELRDALLDRVATGLR
jgi:hypothetical protein